MHTILAPKKKEKVKFLLRKNSFGNNFDIQNRRSGFYGILSAPYLNNKTPTSLTHGISDVNRYRLILFTQLYRNYVPDFGYQENLEFRTRSGWKFLGEIIRKYPTHERMSNVINHLNQI